MKQLDITAIDQIGVALPDWVTTYLLKPWTLYQLGIILGCYLASLVAASWLEPILEEQARRLRGNPRLLRAVVVALRRTKWFILVFLLWVAKWIVAANTWQSRSYIISLAIVLAFVWLALAILTRVIRNKTIARTVAFCAFAYFAVSVLGIREEVSAFLESIAVPLGTFRISLLSVISAVIVTVILLWLATSAGRIAENRINRLEDLSPSVQVLLGKLVRILLTILAIALAVSSTGIDLTAFTVLSGAIGVGLGFGLQKVVSNLISGIIILGDSSIKPGDTIQLGETFGWIKDLRARYVSVITRDGREYLIPNEDFITQQVVNWSYSDNYVRLDVDFGVSYESDPHEVIAIAIATAKSIKRVVRTKQPVCWMTAFGASSLDFKLRFWIEDPQQGLTNIRGQILIALWDAFKANNISIPFPHREIIMKTPVDIRSSPPADKPQKPPRNAVRKQKAD